MSNGIELENIEDARQEQGIDDVELRLEIRDLRVGDFVRLTFMTKPPQTVLVRVTQIRGSAFRGKLSKKVARLRAGDIVVFSASHIHSVVAHAETQGKTNPRSHSWQ